MGYIKEVFDNYFTRDNDAPNQDANRLVDGVLQPEDELTLKMEDKELLELARKWEQDWQNGTSQLKEDWKKSENYWKGLQKDSLNLNEVGADNRIFMAFETFLPIATKENPDAVVSSSDKSPDVKKFADLNREILMYFADVSKIKQRLRRLTRYWGIYKVGPIKVGYDEVKRRLVLKVIRPDKIILDPNATIDDDGYTGEYVGEIREDRADVLVERFPEKKADIERIVNNKMGTKVIYHEYCTDEYMFWKYKDIVLGKTKNPYFNYSGEEVTQTDEMGEQQVVEQPPLNHFNRPQKPYFFLSVFSLGKHPWDDTTLLDQVIPLQDIADKRMKQIDRNADDANAGLIMSGTAFTREQARSAVKELRKGNGILVPNGDVNTAVRRDTGTPLQPYVYQNLQDARGEIDNIFGTHSTTRGEQATQETASGRVLLKGQDEGRIAFITSYLEQVADDVYNMWLQMIYTLFTEKDVADVLGVEKAAEWQRIKDQYHPKLLVSVKANSMMPHDTLSEHNKAIELAQMKLIDPLTMLERIDDPNPMQTYERLVKFSLDPMSLLPQAAQQQVVAGEEMTPIVQ